MRPRKYYIQYEYGQAIAIIEGCDAARRVHAFGSFPDRLSAEEHYAWWNYKAYQPGGHLAHLNTTAQTPLSHRP